jgi:hypothetical protein
VEERRDCDPSRGCGGRSACHEDSESTTRTAPQPAGKTLVEHQHPVQAGVDRALIALWLGHESVETTQIYLDADLALKEKLLAKTTPIKGNRGSYRPDDHLLGFLKNL